MPCNKVLLRLVCFVAIIGGLVSLAGFLVWNTLVRIEKKVDDHTVVQQKCREELPEKFVKRDELKEHRCEFKEWQEGRDEIWEAINKHSHDAGGRVIR